MIELKDIGLAWWSVSERTANALRVALRHLNRAFLLSQNTRIMTYFIENGQSRTKLTKRQAKLIKLLLKGEKHLQKFLVKSLSKQITERDKQVKIIAKEAHQVQLKLNSLRIEYKELRCDLDFWMETSRFWMNAHSK